MKSQITIGMLLVLLAVVPRALSVVDDAKAAGETQAVELQSRLSPLAAEIVKLADSGVEESVLLDYVHNASSSFQLTADDIIYLRDVGISTDVISAMLRHDETLQLQANSADQASASQANETNNPPTVTNVTDAASSTNAPSYVGNAPAEVQPFYDSLSPYGTWINVEDQGWAWQPNVVVVNSGWRPYCNDGRWIWTDAGWYWASDYSWGWAPFHYGRWWCSPRWKWVWFPDTTWGPSWVTWRTFDDFCGWAPLPPRAVFTDFGFRFHNAFVGANFGFGLSSDCFTFVHSKHFFSHDFRRSCLPKTHVNQFFNNSKVINNFAVNSHNKRIINRGIDVNRVAKFTGKTINAVPVIDRSLWADGFHQPRHIVKNGTTVGLVRTPLPNASHGETFVAQKADPQKAIVPSVPQRFANAPVNDASPQTISRTSSQGIENPNNAKVWNSAPRSGSTFNSINRNRANSVKREQSSAAVMQQRSRTETRNPAAKTEIREPSGAPSIVNPNLESGIRSRASRSPITTTPAIMPKAVAPSTVPPTALTPSITSPRLAASTKAIAPSAISRSTTPSITPPKATPSIKPSASPSAKAIAPSAMPPRPTTPAMTPLGATAPPSISRAQNFSPPAQRFTASVQPIQHFSTPIRPSTPFTRQMAPPPQQRFSMPQRDMRNGNAPAFRAVPATPQRAAPMAHPGQSFGGSRGGGNSGMHHGRK